MLKRILVSMVLLLSGLTELAAAFEEQAVTFKSDDNTSLNGTLTFPENKNADEKFSAVLLIAGSGPTDRDGNQPPQVISDLLKQVAHELALHGIASFRFDKRAAHASKLQWPASQGMLPQFFSWKNHEADVRAAFSAMRRSNRVDSHRLAILGHSEGGVLALSQAATLSPKSLILIGTPGRSFGEVLTEQIGALLDKQGVPDTVKSDYLNRNAAIQKYIFENGEIPSDVPAGLKALYPPSARLFLKDIMRLEPTSFGKSYRGRVLIMNGELDSQVHPIRDAKALETAFQARKLSSQQLEIIPSGSHNLKKISTALDPGISGPVDPNALAVLITWLSKNH
ncbi:MAG: hypothetical protein IPJ84_06820 [Bdellovibrionales bacterium]|nr:hypothetical protein [Bdellovibrionales bacterium]